MNNKPPRGGRDLFADALCDYFYNGRASLYTERDDGLRTREDVSWYFTSFRNFPPFERQALKFARGRVLDVGCGAGRHSLYLQRRGFDVVGIDRSPRIVELARRRGVRDVRVADVCRKLPFDAGEFETVFLFGNNLGICGTVPRFRRMLRELYRVTLAHANILATTRVLNRASIKDNRYISRNLRKGRPAGQVRMRLERKGNYGPWFELLLFEPSELHAIAGEEGWALEHVFTESVTEGYAVVLKKTRKR